MFANLFGSEKLTHNYGFYIDRDNKDSFLFNSILKNNIETPITFFKELVKINPNKKWFCPIFCDIFLFNNYRKTLYSLRNIIEKNNGYFFFDMSIEAMLYYPNDCFMGQKFKLFHEMLEICSVDPSRVFFVNANLVSDQYYDQWREANNIKYKIANDHILTHQYSLGGFSSSFERYFKNNNLLKKNIDLIEDSIRNKIFRKYHFTCLILRPRYHRTSIALHLLERNHFNKGIISYFGNEFGNKDAPTVEQESVTYALIASMKSGNRLLSKWEQLIKMSPITIDAMLGTLKKGEWAPKELGFFPRAFIEDTSTIATRSYFEIVVETYFTDASCLYLTEKTLWAILSFQPFILVGSPFTLQYLRTLGFQTFSPYIDETYDTITDPKMRMELIMQEIDRLCALSIKELHELYCELWPRLYYNCMHYFQNSRTLAAEQISTRILNKIN